MFYFSLLNAIGLLSLLDSCLPLHLLWLYREVAI